MVLAEVESVTRGTCRDKDYNMKEINTEINGKVERLLQTVGLSANIKVENYPDAPFALVPLPPMFGRDGMSVLVAVHDGASQVELARMQKYISELNAVRNNRLDYAVLSLEAFLPFVATLGLYTGFHHKMTSLIRFGNFTNLFGRISEKKITNALDYARGRNRGF